MFGGFCAGGGEKGEGGMYGRIGAIGKKCEMIKKEARYARESKASYGDGRF